MFSLIKAAYLLVLISVLVVSSAAQSARRGPPFREKDVRASAEVSGEDKGLALEQRRALWLLDQLLEQAKSCDDETFRIRTQAHLADLLWKYDEARARLQFGEAFDAIESIEPEPQDDASAQPRALEYGRQYDLRLEVLELITHHDPEWATKLGLQTGIELSDVLDRNEAKQSALRAQTNALGRASQGATSATPAVGGPPAKFLLMSRPLRPASVGDLLSQAEMAKSTLEKDGLYARAARQALVENDFDLALSIAEKIKSEQSRASVEAVTRQRAATAAITRDDFVTAGRYARDLSGLVQRATVFDQMLRAIEKRKDLARSANTLTEAEQAFEKAKGGWDKARALLIIASAAARIDPLRGFDIMGSAIAAINRVDLDNHSHHSSAQSELNPETLDFDEVFSRLACADYDRALQLAQVIERREFSVLAQLAICHGLLTQIP